MYLIFFVAFRREYLIVNIVNNLSLPSGYHLINGFSSFFSRLLLLLLCWNCITTFAHWISLDINWLIDSFYSLLAQSFLFFKVIRCIDSAYFVSNSSIRTLIFISLNMNRFNLKLSHCTIDSSPLPLAFHIIYYVLFFYVLCCLKKWFVFAASCPAPTSSRSIFRLLCKIQLRPFRKLNTS